MTHGDQRAAYERAVAGKSRLFAVWPGQWSSDLFEVDDLDEFAKAHGIRHDDERTGLKNHVHKVEWVKNPHGNDNPRSQYLDIDVTLTSGCSINDRCTFAAQMKEQKGWDIATSGGWSKSGRPGGTTTYSLRARRKSLT
ncbi:MULTISPECIES: hypothetical protein [Streptomyces]|uniref:Uncharacterized protein n=1 Tax=Streptomyces doudnae TaxID=3075536 RepID=A0ABD5EZJ6_9ACTN|nr:MULTISPECIES: hypothetical protein [unclassified Streptomyces]MDT0438999.1 hypothetical protein [Streptomyces sp. DSM 41981]